MHWKKFYALEEEVNKLLIFLQKQNIGGKNEFFKNDKNKIWITSIIIKEKIKCT